MGAPRTLLCLALLACASATTPLNVPSAEKKVELFDGVTMHFPTTTPESTNGTEHKLVSFQIDTDRSIQEGRGKQKQQTSLMQRILPMFIMPFLIQSTIVPMFLSMLKFMLFKAMMVGKLALALILFNAFKNHNTFKGRHEKEIANVHYGYHGDMEEYGAYIH